MRTEIDQQGAPTQRLAQATGAVYLLLAALAMFSGLMVESVVEPGDAAATADNIADSQGLFAASLVSWIGVVLADIVLSVLSYLLLRPVSGALALLTAAVRLAYSAMLATILVPLYDAYLLLTDADRAAPFGEADVPAMALSAVDSFSTGFAFALIFFGVHVVLLGYLLYRSRYVPRVISALVVVAGASYIVDNLANIFVADYGGAVNAIVIAPTFVAELILALWLVVKGVRGPR